MPFRIGPLNIGIECHATPPPRKDANHDFRERPVLNQAIMSGSN